MNSDYYINLHFNQAIPQKTGYAFKIGDKGCTFHLHCVDLNPTGMNPHIVFNHSNGTCVEGVPTVSGQDYVYVIQGNEFGVCGQVVVDMKFYDAIGELATQRISTASFTLDVIPDTLTPFDESSSSYADSLEHAREELDDATGDLADMDALFAQTLQDYIDAFGNTAPINPRGEYDPNELYKPRDAVYYTYGGKTVTYMNNLECTGIAPTNTSNWQPIIDIPSLPAVIDSCTSTSTTDALSANQGKVLRDNLEHENLLHNAYFIGGGSQQGGHQFPINSRALTSYASGSGYSIDRWTLENTANMPSLTVESDGIVLTHPNTTGTYSFFQYIDDYAQYIGKTLTVSFLGELLEGTNCNIIAWYHPFTTDYRGDSVTTAFSDGLKSLTFTVPNDAEGLAVIVGASGANSPYKVKLKAAKMELGDTQTLAHKVNNVWVLNDAEPDFALELAKCRASKVDAYDTHARKGELVNFNDVTTIKAIGTKNYTGAQIKQGAHFYLNDTLCIALQNISTNADFTLNTNYEVESIANLTDRKFDLLGSSTTLEGSVAFTVTDLRKYRNILCKVTVVYNDEEQDWAQNQIVIPTTQILNQNACVQSSHQLVPSATLNNVIYLYVHATTTGVDYWFATYTGASTLSPTTWIFRVYGIN